MMTMNAAMFHLAIVRSLAMCTSTTSSEASDLCFELQYPYCHQIKAAESKSIVEVDGSIHRRAVDTIDHPNAPENPSWPAIDNPVEMPLPTTSRPTLTMMRT